MSFDPHSFEDVDFSRTLPALPQPPAPATKKKPELKNSGVGIASFITSLISGCLAFGSIATGLVMEAALPEDEELSEANIAVIVLSFIFFMLGTLLALVMGIAGLCQKDRKKLFAYLGVIVSSFTLLVVVVMMVLGPPAE